MHVKAIRVLVETVTEIISPTASTTLSQPFESSSELSITSQESACRLQRPRECISDRESVSKAVRVLIEALRCFRGRARLEEVPENAISKRFGFVPKSLD